MLFPPEKVRKKRREEGGKKTASEGDRMGEETVGKGELLHEFSRGNQVISRGTPATHSVTIVLFTARWSEKNDYPVNDGGRVAGSSKK